MGLSDTRNPATPRVQQQEIRKYQYVCRSMQIRHWIPIFNHQFSMKHIEKIQNILKSELEDYSFDYYIELDYEETEEEQYTVKVEDRY